MVCGFSSTIFGTHDTFIRAEVIAGFNCMEGYDDKTLIIVFLYLVVK